MNTTIFQHSTRFEELVQETDLIATVKLTPSHFTRSHQLNFISSYDDLDFLTFASLVLPSGHKIALVRHQNAPYSGTEIRVASDLSFSSTVLAEALDVLALSFHDLDWIHPHLDLSKSLNSDRYFPN